MPTNRADFEVGSIVYLNSGSPRLTIEDMMHNTNLVRVVWLDAINKLQRAELPTVCLTFTETHQRKEDMQ